MAPGELIRVGGRLRKDVAGLRPELLLIGSEGTLGVITSVWLSCCRRPRWRRRWCSFYRRRRTGCAAIEQVLGNGLVPAALDFVDEGALAVAGQLSRSRCRPDPGFLLLPRWTARRRRPRAQRDGARGARRRPRRCSLHEPPDGRALWRWRDGFNGVVTAVRGRR